MKRGVIVLAAACVAACCAWSEPRLVVQSGHTGAVDALAYDSADALLFSGGSDGTVRAWNPTTGEEVCAIQAGHFPVLLLSVDPAASRVAVFESDGIGVFRISVWDWKLGRLLFTHDLSEAPLFLTYSPRGSYLVYGIAEWRSLTFLDAKSGEALPFFQSGFGIVTAAIVSDSERSVLTYNPAGEIDYWSLPSCALKRAFRTSPELDGVGFAANARYMVGFTDEEFDVIDLLSGAVLASAPQEGTQLLAADPDGASIVCYTGGSDRESASPIAQPPELSLWTFSGTLDRDSGAVVTPRPAVTSLLFASGTLYASLADGTIYAEQPSSGGETLGERELADATDVGVSGGRVLVSSASGLFSFGTDFLGAEAGSAGSLDVSANPFPSGAGVAGLGDGRFAVWSTASAPEAVDLFEDDSPGGPTLTSVALPSAGASAQAEARLLEVAPFGSDLALLDSSGQCSIVDPGTGSSLFSYASFGIKSLTPVGSSRFIIGQHRSSELNSPLVQITTTTSETVPIPSADSLVFDTAYAPPSDTLFTLGIRSQGGSLSTLLESHQVSGLTGGTEVLAYPGVDLDATLAVDGSTGDLYTTLGMRGVRRISAASGSVAYLERSDHLPRKLLVSGGLLIALNSDGTLTVWDKLSGRRTLDLYLFKDSSWIMLFPGGTFAASPGGEQHLRAFDGTSEISDVSSFRSTAR